jgi:DNA-binding FadR family transcriptional regulator
MAFKKIEQKRAYQLVAEQVEEAILSGAFKPGDKLPPEREMKEMVEAVKARDGERAFSLANDHIQKFFRYVEGAGQNADPYEEASVETHHL